jgi:hypothetical protein
MTKSTSSLNKAAPAAKKKNSKYYRPFWIFLMYFMQLRYPVKGSIAFLLSFYDQCRHDMQTFDVLLMLFLFSLHQKSPPLVPYDFCWFCCFDADGDQLFAVIKRVVNAAIILDVIFFVVVDCDVEPTTLC